MPKFVPERDLPSEIITAVGLLTIHASRVDTGLQAVLAAATQTRIAQAGAILHSTGSAKARLDLVRASVSESGIPEDNKAAVYKLLDQAAGLNDKRNEWVHGWWHPSDGGNGHQVTLYWPNRKKPEKIKPLDASAAPLIRQLCADYDKVTTDLCLLSTRLHQPPVTSA